MPDTPALSWIAFIIGLFYAVGGIAVMRRMAMDSLLDQALAALGSPVDENEKTVSRLLTVGGWLTFASGVSLMGLSRWAPYVFGLNVVWQAGYLLWAARHNPPQDEAERLGRQNTINAFLIYTGVFGFVLLLTQQGVWRSWNIAGAPLPSALVEFGLILSITAVFAFLIGRPAQRKQSGPLSAFASDPDADYEISDPDAHCLRLAPEYGCSPLWNCDLGEPVDPENLYIHADLVRRIFEWDEAFQATLNPDDPATSGFADLEAERAWAMEGRAISDAISSEWPGEYRDALSALPALMQKAHDGLAPYSTVPPERIPVAAAGCGMFEVIELLEDLKHLSAEKEKLPAWDGDTHDDCARAQILFARILVRTAPRYRPEIDRALTEADEETCRWINFARGELTGV